MVEKETDNGLEEVLKQGPTYKEFGKMAESEVGEDNSGKTNRIFGCLQEMVVSKIKLTRKTCVFFLIAILGLMITIGLIMKGSAKDGNGSDKRDNVGSHVVTPQPTIIYEVITATPTINPVSVWFTDEEVILLREAGYTGGEIESFAEYEMDASELINSAEAKQEELIAEKMKPYIDSKSDEYKALEASTWVGLEELVVDEEISKYDYHTTTLNLDYEKIPTMGAQLFIKIYWDEVGYCFMQVKPKNWLLMQDEGNIVVSIDYLIMANGQIIVTDIKEKSLY